MSAKAPDDRRAAADAAAWALALLLILGGLCAARGQESAPAFSADRDSPTAAGETGPLTPEKIEVAPTPAPYPAGTLPPPSATPPPTLSSWITHTRPDCCYPFGGCGPINTELYIRNGPSIPAGGGILHHVLDTGWNLQAGGRSLFFNPGVDAAWAVDLQLSYTYNQAQSTPTVNLPATFFPPGTVAGPGGTLPSHLKNMHRTFANGYAGREWYLNAPANASGWKWRVGLDLGGGIGTGKVNVVETRHRTDTLFRTGPAFHTDLEAPWGCCTFVGGFRAEWDYMWSDILWRNNNAQLQDVNLLFTLGVRF